MTTMDLTTTTDAVFVGVPMMDEAEARESIALMRADMGMVETYADSFRRRALDFRDREGWRALGYPGAIVAIQTELGTQYSKSYLSRLLQAAEIERVLELPIGNAVPESVLREVAKVETPAQQRIVYQAATANGTPTAKQVQQAASEIAGWVCDLCGQNQTGMRKPNPAHCTMCAMKRLDQAMRPEPPDLPPEFAIVQRRLAAHGIALTHRMQNGVLLFQRQSSAGTPISTMEWSYVLEKLATLEDSPDPDPAASAFRMTCPTCGEPILNGVWGDLKECGSCFHARARTPSADAATPAAPTIADLDAALPARLPAVPVRPKQPVSADASAVIAYLKALERYASALESVIQALQKRMPE